MKKMLIAVALLACTLLCEVPEAEATFGRVAVVQQVRVQRVRVQRVRAVRVRRGVVAQQLIVH